MARFNPKKISSWFKGKFSKKKTQKPTTLDSTIEAKEVTAADKERLTPAQMRKKYFLAPEEAGLGYVVPLKGAGFIQKNERLMARRKSILGEFEITGRKAERVLELFRLRKAASIVSNTRGFASEATTKALLAFMREQHKKYVERKDESRAQISEFSIKCLTSALENKDRTRVNQVMDNPFNEGLYEETLVADYALNPHKEANSRLVSGNPMGYMIAFELAEKELAETIGESYSRFKEREKQERKRI